jgi:2-methylfumaryl-CoA isomerase
MVVALTARHWHDLLEVSGTQKPVAALEAALGVDFSIEDDRFEYREVLAGLIQRWFAARSAAEVSRVLAGTSLLWAPYRSFAEAVAHLQTPEGANPLMSVVDQPGIGPHLAPGSPLVFATWPGRAQPAPLLGQHSVQLLADELGLSADEIDSLRAQRIVTSTVPDPAPRPMS